MTNYHLTPPQTLPSLAAKEACEKRRQVLAAVRQRRKRIYKHFREQMRSSTNTKDMILPPNHSMGSVERHQEQDIPHSTEQQASSLAEAALTYAQHGWPVFPLHGKLPYAGTHGSKDATTDQEYLHALWTLRPSANIGLATGEVSGVIVLDIDPRNGGYFSLKELQQRYGDLPQTRTSRTAHGGLHKFFAYPQDGNIYPNTVRLATLPGLDIRGEGGYVVLPPSTLYNRLRYKWAEPEHNIAPVPDWLLNLLPRQEPRQQALAQDRRFADSPGEKWLRDALLKATEGNRNTVGFSLACQLRDDGVSQTQAQSIILAHADRVAPGTTPYTRREALASLRSAYSRPPRPPARRRER